MTGIGDDGAGAYPRDFTVSKGSTTWRILRASRAHAGRGEVQSMWRSPPIRSGDRTMLPVRRADRAPWPDGAAAGSPGWSRPRPSAGIGGMWRRLSLGRDRAPRHRDRPEAHGLAALGDSSGGAHAGGRNHADARRDHEGPTLAWSYVAVVSVTSSAA